MDRDTCDVCGRPAIAAINGRGMCADPAHIDRVSREEVAAIRSWFAEVLAQDAPRPVEDVHLPENVRIIPMADPPVAPDPTLFDPPPRQPADYNTDDSDTGRVFRGASQSVRDAAELVDARGHRARILRMVIAAGDHGLTSKEAARDMPRTAEGDRQLSNRSSSRLGELWELGQVTVVRAGGACILGVCHPHHKPRIVHRPTAACARHGSPLRRDGANIWRLATTDEQARAAAAPTPVGTDPQPDGGSAGDADCGPLRQRIADAEAAIARVIALCDHWDEMTKGASPSSRVIRAAIRGDE